MSYQFGKSNYEKRTDNRSTGLLKRAGVGLGLAALSLVTAAQSASASFFESGVYSDNYWKAATSYRVQRSELMKADPTYRDEAGLYSIKQTGSQVEIYDRNARRMYRIDLSNSGEQNGGLVVATSRFPMRLHRVY